jgi:hypothetical protein
MNSFKKNSAFLLSIALATPFAFSSEFGQEKDSDKPVAMNVKEISSAHLMPPRLRFHHVFNQIILPLKR